MSNEEQTTEIEQNEQLAEAAVDAQLSTEGGDELASSGIDALQQQIEALKQELVETKDQALRTVAEAQNFKRRVEKDVENTRKFALEKFATAVLAVGDNLERALEAADKDSEVVKPLYEGIELTQKNLADVLSKFNVESIDPLGEPFDPQYHQAMSMVDNPDVEPNSITLVMQKGYSLNGRLLRPAMVVIAKAPVNKIDEQA